MSPRDQVFLGLATVEAERFVGDAPRWHSRPAVRLAAAVVTPALACFLVGLFAGVLHAGPWLSFACTVAAALPVAAGLYVARAVVRRPLRRWERLARAHARRNGGPEFAMARDDFAAAGAALDALLDSLQARARRTEEMLLAEQQGASDLQRQYALMQLLRDLATLGQEGGTLEQAMERALHQIGNYLDWPVGRLVWSASKGAGAVRRSHWFAREDAAVRRFIEASEHAGEEAEGEGLLGRARQSNLPHWVSDLSRLEGWTRAEAARACGLRTGVVIPVAGAHSQAAFLEFFSRHRIEPTLELLELVEAIREELWVVAEQLAPAERCEVAFPVLAGTGATAGAFDPACTPAPSNPREAI